MTDFPALDPRAVALTVFRCLPDGTGREYTATTFPQNPLLGCNHMIRQARACGFIAKCEGRCDHYAVLDVLDDDGDIIQDFCVTTAQAFRWFYRKLKRPQPRSGGKPLMTEITLRTDPPYSPEYTREVGRALAEAVRVLNHATHPANEGGLEYPGDAYDLLGHLYTATQRLDQLLDQLDAFLAAQYNSGRLAAQDGGSVAALIGGAGAELRYATASAGDLTARLQRAQSAISGLYVKDDADG